MLGRKEECEKGVVVVVGLFELVIIFTGIEETLYNTTFRASKRERVEV